MATITSISLPLPAPSIAASSTNSVTTPSKLNQRQIRRIGCSCRFRAELPPDIWKEIGKRIDSRFDIARFRSVCRACRSSLPPPSRFPLLVPPPPLTRVCPGYRPFITEHRYYAVDTRSNEAAEQPNRRLVLMEAINRRGDKFEPSAFLPGAKSKKTVRISQISSRDSFLHNFYTLRVVRPDKEEWTTQILHSNPQIVFIFSNSTCLDPNCASKCDVTVVSRLLYGSLALLRLGDGLYHDPLLLNWENDFCSFKSKDIISYNGKLYTVDRSGRAFVMDYQSLHMTQVAAAPYAISHAFGELIMKLVEASGELYSVVSNPNPNPIPKLYLKVYRLRSELQEWGEVKELGDEEVFVLCGDDCFSVGRDVFADFELMDLRYEESVALFFSQSSFLRTITWWWRSLRDLYGANQGRIQFSFY